MFIIATPAVTALSSFDSSIIDDYVSKEMEEFRIPGLAVGIIQNREIVHLKGYGVANFLEDIQIDKNTPFLIGSLTKSVTAIATMQLVDRGILKLEDSVDKHIAGFELSGIYEKNSIKVQHLLSHTSGIPTNAGLKQMSEDGSLSLKEEVELLHSVEVIHKPGDNHEYSNVNYLILGLLIEQITGTSYSEYIINNVLEPLDMNNTFLNKADGLTANMSAGHIKVFGKPRPIDGQYLQSSLPAGFIISSINDMTNYLSEHITYNQKLLSDSAMQKLHQGNTPINNTDLNYAMGLISIENEEFSYLFHDGVTQGYNSAMAFSPEKGWGVIILTNIASQIELPAGEMAMNIAKYLNGDELVSTSETDYNTYNILLSLTISILAFSILSTYLLIKKNKNYATKINEKSLSKIIIAFLSLIIELAFPLVVLIIIPRGAGFSVWKVLSLFHPDLIYVLLISSIIMGVKGLIRAYIIFNSRKLTIL